MPCSIAMLHYHRVYIYIIYIYTVYIYIQYIYIQYIYSIYIYIQYIYSIYIYTDSIYTVYIYIQYIYSIYIYIYTVYNYICMVLWLVMMWILQTFRTEFASRHTSFPTLPPHIATAADRAIPRAAAARTPWPDRWVWAPKITFNFSNKHGFVWK